MWVAAVVLAFPQLMMYKWMRCGLQLWCWLFTAHHIQVDEMWVAAVMLVGTADDSMANLEGSAVTVRAAVGCHLDAVSLSSAHGQQACNAI